MLTPLLEKYNIYQKDIETKYGEDSVVMIQVGSFYEIYGFNCEKIKLGNLKKMTDILGITLTKKNKAKEHNVNNPYLCGLPSYALSKHLSTLLKNGITVAIYNQYDIPNKKEKGHKLLKIYSNSTYIDEEICENNELMCIIINEIICPIHNIKLNCGYISHIDLSTGKSKLYELYDTKDNRILVKDEIYKIICSINPSEIIYISDNNLIKIPTHIQTHIHILDKKYKDITFQNFFLQKIFGSQYLLTPIEYLDLQHSPDLVSCFIKLLDFAHDHDPNIIQHISKPQIISYKDFIYNMDALLELNITSGETSLFNIIDKTRTRMGKRLLKDRLLQPITNINELNNRYDKIELIKDKEKKYKDLLDGINDIEKQFRKLSLHTLTPIQFSNLDLSFINILKLLKLNKNNFNITDQTITDFGSFYSEYRRIFNIKEMSKCDINNITNSFFNTGIFSDIDILYHKINKINDLFQKLTGLLENNRAKVSIHTSDKEGYTLKTTKKAWTEIKDNDRKIKIDLDDFDEEYVFLLDLINIEDSKKNYVRVKSPFFDKLTNQLHIYITQISEQVLSHYYDICSIFNKNYSPLIYNIVSIISDIDISLSSYVISKKYSYTRPKLVDNPDSYIICNDIRHPIVERIQDTTEYVPNNIDLHSIKGMLLFGLNSSGKSTFLRSLGMNIILAQAGMFVSCSSLVLSPFSKLLTKIASHDNLFKGQSTFINEIMELKMILENANNNSLILCDELTSGTETGSSIGIVSSTLLTLINKNSKFLFTTHLHQLMDFDELKDNKDMNIFHFKISFNNGDIKFERKLVDGSGPHKYGIEIAQYLNLDSEFIATSHKYRKLFYGESTNFVSNKRSHYNSKVIVDNCQMCGKQGNDSEHLHTHHINEQHTSNEHGIIKHFHKNVKFNLMVLCEQCHNSVHHPSNNPD